MESNVNQIDNAVCVRGGWLYGEGNVMTKPTYDWLCKNGGIKKTRSCAGNPAWVVFKTLPAKYRELALQALGVASETELTAKTSNGLWNDMLISQPVGDARKFFEDYRYGNEQSLPADKVTQYTNEAIILRTCIQIIAQRRMARATMAESANVTELWQKVAIWVSGLDNTRYTHQLPSHANRLRMKADAYNHKGNAALIHRNYGNANAQKTNDYFTRIVCSLHTLETIPFVEKTWQNYMAFVAGQIDLVDKSTGEIFDRTKLFDEAGNPLVVSVATVRNTIERYAMAVNSKRMSRIDYNTQLTAYSHRRSPSYSLSKISLDDRTLSRKTDTGEWVNAYLAFDVASGVCLAAVFDTRKPDKEMVFECLRELYFTSAKYKLRWAGEAEVENHLMRELEDVMRNVFQILTFCNPGESQSKRAEHLIKSLKYETEKNNHKGIGRWNLKGPYKVIQEKKKESDDDKTVQLPYHRIVADFKADIYEHNHKMHPRQDLYQGLTRWEVLLKHQNPNLAYPNTERLIRQIGYMTETSITRNDQVRVQYADYGIEQYEAIQQRLTPGINRVQAYYLPTPESDEINEVYLYQGERLISKATKYIPYNEAKIERTPQDEAIFLEQQKRQSKQRKFAKEMKEKVLAPIEIVKHNTYMQVEEPEIVIVETPAPKRRQLTDEEQELNAINNL